MLIYKIFTAGGYSKQAIEEYMYIVSPKFNILQRNVSLSNQMYIYFSFHIILGACNGHHTLDSPAEESNASHKKIKNKKKRYTRYIF